MPQKLSTVFTLLILWSASLIAQKNLLFRHIDTKGYSILTFYKDANSVMWLGTNSGLVSFPQLMSRTPNAYDRGHQELNSSIYLMSGDEDGKLWMKNINRDVVMYDPIHNSIESNTSQLLSQMGVNVWKEYNIQVEKSGKGWVWKGDKLYCISSMKENKVWKEMSFNGENVLGVNNDGRYMVVLTQKALHYISEKDGKTQRQVVHKATGQLWSYITVMPNNDVWLRHGKTLNIYDYNAGTWKNDVVFPSEISGMNMDAEQNMWVSTTNNGIYIYDSQGNMLRHLTHDVWDSNTLQSNKICTINYDKDSQAMWIAYIKGGLSICSQKKGAQLNLIGEKLPQHFPTDVLTLATDRKGTMYAGLEDGLYEKTDSEDWKNTIANASICALLHDKNDVLWAGLYAKGLMKRGGDGKEIMYFPNSSPYDFVEYTLGMEQYICTALLGEGVWQLNVKTGEVKDLKIPDSYALDLEYFENKLYAATTGGFWTMEKDGVWRKLCDGKFRSFCIDSRGNKWILGNEGYEGLTVLDMQNKPVEVSQHLAHASLRSIAVDDEDRVWITTGNELIMMNMEHGNTEKIAEHLFDVNSLNGYVYYNYHAILIDKENHLWLGTNKGYQCFSIRDLLHQIDHTPSSNTLYIGSISVNDRVCSPGESSDGKVLFNKDVIFCKELNLKHNENNIVIECTQSCNKDFDTHIYYYKLKGSNDESWHLLKDNQIILSNLSYGNYQLMVRTQSSEEQQLLAIHIAPPFWLSVWAYLLYAALILLALYGAHRYYNNKKAYQLRLRKLKQEQEQQSLLNEMKLKFFTNISHDLRTPLSLIIGPAEDLADQLKDTRQRDSVNLIIKNAKHLLTLVNQILDFRKLEFGREKLIMSYGDVVSFISDICDTFKLKSSKENIKLQFHSSVESAKTLFDRDKTTKIMMNLLSNAFKFTTAEGCIDITLDVSDDMITVSVIDTGIGIPDKEKAHIFDRFYQASSNNMRSSIGSGIGLHLVREYVLLQGGDITVSDNAEGKGSVFRFTIPVRGSSEIQNFENSELQKAENTEIQNLQDTDSRLTLLIVDDNQDLLTYMCQSFADTYRVLTAEDGKQALEMLQSEDIDIIISDVMMPEIDGIELCRRVKSNIETSHIPVVLLTAKAMNSDELQGLEAGADDYVTKPFSMHILQHRVHNIVERSKSHYQRFATEIDVEPSEITITSLDEQFIAQAIAIVEEHIGEADFSVEQLSDEMGVHRSQLYKKILHLTGKTPVAFIRVLRLKRGKQLLEQSGMYVSEVAYQVGFNSPRLFSKYFKEEFGMTPKEYTK